MNTRSGIYYIIVDCAGVLRWYAGKAHDLCKRRSQHFISLRKGNHANRFLQRAWEKYGEASFTFLVIENCSPSELRNKEQVHLDRLRAEYGDDRIFNILKECVDTRLGVQHTEETRKRFRELWSDPVIRNARIVAQRRTKDTPESKERRSAAAKEANARPEVIALRRASFDDPSAKAMHAAAVKAALAKPDIKARHKESCKRAQNTKEVKERQRLFWADSEKRAKQIAAIRTGMAAIIITETVREQKRAAANARWDRVRAMKVSQDD